MHENKHLFSEDEKKRRLNLLNQIAELTQVELLIPHSLEGGPPDEISINTDKLSAVVNEYSTMIENHRRIHLNGQRAEADKIAAFTAWLIMKH